MSLFGGIANFIGDLGIPVVSNIANAVSGLIDKPDSPSTPDKVAGVPTPAPRTGADIGVDYRGFLDAAYPGTTPWERLGANSPMGAIQSAESTQKSAQIMQARELENRSSVASSNNRAQIIAAATPLGPRAVSSALSAYGLGMGGDYDTSVAQGRERLPSEIARSGASTALDTARLPRQQLEGKAATGISRFFDRIGYSPQDPASFYGGALQTAYKPYKAVADFVMNRLPRPRRFGVSSV